MATNDVDLHLRLSRELREKLKAAATKARRSMTDYLRLIIEDAVTEHDAPHLTIPKPRSPKWANE